MSLFCSRIQRRSPYCIYLLSVVSLEICDSSAVFLSFRTLKLLKSIGHLFCRMFFNLGSWDVFSKMFYTIGKIIINVKYLSQGVTSEGIRCQNVIILMILYFIHWLRWCLCHKHHFFLWNYSIYWERYFGTLQKSFFMLKILPAYFSIYQCLLFMKIFTEVF